MSLDSIRGDSAWDYVSDHTLPHPSLPHPMTLTFCCQVLLVGMGNRNLRPVLLARVEEDLLMYEVFPFYENLSPTQLKIRLRLIEHNLILREKRSSRNRRKAEEEGSSGQERKIDRVSKLRGFSNISVYSGVFICGPYPHWVFMTVRGELRYHPMSVDGSVKCFAPFRNINCQNGFLYFNRKVILVQSLRPRRRRRVRFTLLPGSSLSSVSLSLVSACRLLFFDVSSAWSSLVRCRLSPCSSSSSDSLMRFPDLTVTGEDRFRLLVCCVLSFRLFSVSLSAGGLSGLCGGAVAPSEGSEFAWLSPFVSG
ncbi:Cleavage and polyadenylation specificity factor subunit 1 [Portunus trituberculatus]|uniref:Cleavage and polyadenylation specificity factor subunit 1 n=1 Tax=Portunus trituberculatus TaxID=210409 RepID=A0A5B7D564_PORTR|nr:Cleavage and polyadenylation specificity factor subunit 1 [Portunus trituberculatus]